MAVDGWDGYGKRRSVLGALPERAPRLIGPYRILARLGSGGMGEVYLGADTRPAAGGAGPRLAAVKTVRPELVGDQAFRDRFRREMDTARSVESRFAARLLTGDAEAARPWLATEYVVGPRWITRSARRVPCPWRPCGPSGSISCGGCAASTTPVSSTGI
ncbi:hypothetical protein [Streptomyces sp. NPDC085466]|uniref:hypothetical protein n=1 Tax=Streptomyces sp. NPDC085466 TaxID=3365725 RepID=UPI0037D8D13A